MGLHNEKLSFISKKTMLYEIHVTQSYMEWNERFLHNQIKLIHRHEHLVRWPTIFVRRPTTDLIMTLNLSCSIQIDLESKQGWASVQAGHSVYKQFKV